MRDSFASLTYRVTQPARHVVLPVLRAREARSVWGAARTADAVASDAELLTRAAVAARARHRIDARLLSVLPPRRRDPVGRVRIARSRAGSDVRRRVALDARVFAVARRAEARVAASLQSMTRLESGAMQA